MASVAKRTNKDGSVSYEIQVSRGRGKAPFSMRWQAPETWSERIVQRELSKVCADFERRCKAGEVLTKKEQKAEELRRAEEESKIQTFKQYVEKVYMPNLEITGAKHTISNFKGNFKNHIYPRIGNMKMPDISSADIKALLLAEQKNLGVSSVVKIYTILNLVFKSAYIEEIIDKNPMDRIKRPSAKKEEAVEEYAESYTAEEMNYILEYLEKESFQWQCFVRLLIDTGCRKGEACGLQWKDIDFENNAISFNRQLCYTPEDGIYTDTLKNRKKRRVFIDPDIMEMLKTLKKSKNKVVSIQKTKQDERYVFTQIMSESKEKTVYSNVPLHPDSPTKYFKKFGQKYGIDHFHPHKCRHTQATIAIENHADIASVSKKLGHSSIDVTLRIYTHPSDESQRDASDKFRSALKNASSQGKQAK